MACALMLINAGALVNSRDTFGNTALHYAAEDGNVPLIGLLVARGANVDFADITNKVRTSIHSGNSNTHHRTSEESAICIMNSDRCADVSDESGALERAEPHRRRAKAPLLRR